MVSSLRLQLGFRLLATFMTDTTTTTAKDKLPQLALCMQREKRRECTKTTRGNIETDQEEATNQIFHVLL